MALLDLLQDYVAETASFLPLARPDLDERRYDLLESADDFEIWAIHWPQGQGLELHDHGGAAGALWVVEGSLEEHYIGADANVGRRSIGAGAGAAFGPSYVHDVLNVETTPATSIHAYSPALESMTFYRRDGRGLRGRSGRVPLGLLVGAVSAVDQLLEQARRRLRRVDAHEAARLFDGGGLLVDIRPAAQRAEFGEIPVALVVERNNLEWRLDPSGAHRLPGWKTPGARWSSSARRATPPVWPRPACSTSAAPR